MPDNHQPPTEANQHEACLLGYLAHQHVSSPWLRLAQPSALYQNTGLSLALHPVGETGKTAPALLTLPAQQKLHTSLNSEAKIACSNG
jgi:hypothetical protein